MTAQDFEINYIPHAGGQEVLDGIAKSRAQFITIDGARGWGKSLFATCEFVLPTLFAKPHTQVQWVAPFYKTCKAVYDDCWKGVDEDTGIRFIPQYSKTGFKFWTFRKNEMELECCNNSVLYFRSADNPESIVAKGYNLIIIDEAALIASEVYYKQIFATARRRGCRIIIISTPRGKNWFYKMYLKGQDQSEMNHISFMQPWWKRPDYPQLLRDGMKDIPEHIRRQEYYAEFVGEGGGVFKNLASVFIGDQIQFPDSQQEWARPIDQDQLNAQTWVMGVDIAKQVDFTVLTVIGSESKEIVYYRRLNKTDYKVVVELIRKVANQYNADVIYDATGVGSGIGDFLSSDLNCFPYVYTNESKKDLINRLILDFEYNQIKIPNIWTIREEFELFTYTLTKTGKISYHGEDSKHDDCVFSVAMANWYAEENKGTGEIHQLDEYLDIMGDIQRPRSRYQQLLDEDD